MKTIRQMSCMLAVSSVIVMASGCRSGGESGLSQSPKPDPTASIAAGQPSLTPQYYSGGPQALPMRSDPSYANEVVSIAKKEKLVTHKPPTPLAQQGQRASRPY